MLPFSLPNPRTYINTSQLCHMHYPYTMSWNKWCVKSISCCQLVSPHLKQPGDEDREANWLRDVGEVLQQRLAAAFHPQVQHLHLVFVAEVSRVVGDLVLDARPGRERVAAAEGDAVYQVFPLHIAS